MRSDAKEAERRKGRKEESKEGEAKQGKDGRGRGFFPQASVLDVIVFAVDTALVVNRAVLQHQRSIG